MDAFLRHAGRVAVVTGGAFGIGRVYSERLARGGANVVIADIADASEVVETIVAAGGRAVGVGCDVADPESVGKLAARVADEGGADILVHNAGIYPLKPFSELTLHDWRRVLSVNLDSLFLLTSALVPTMRERGWGRVVAVSSGMVHVGAPNAVPYVASKAGIIGFIRSLATEVGPDGVTVNALAPGLIRSAGTSTGLHDELGLFDHVVGQQSIKRVKVPSDLTGFLDLLVSVEGGFMTGQTLLIDGGVAHA